ncbi:MAG: hypothetical protein WC775_00905 [Patescibacteria group bacterium]|jgi:hypothetical protein
MKLTFDQALVMFILKHHRNLLIVSAFSVLIIAVLSFGTYNRMAETQTKINDTTRQLSKIKSSFAVSTNLIQELGGKDRILNSFMPSEFDLLVALSTIEEIGERTDFRIQAVTLGAEKPVEGALLSKRISLTASGSFEAFLGFLKDYKVITGQAMSIGAISLSGKEKVISDLSITMYSYKPKIDLNALPDMKNLTKEEKSIIDVISDYVQTATTTSLEDDYTAKEDPFAGK